MPVIKKKPHHTIFTQTQPTAAIHSLPTQHHLTKTFEDLTHQGFGQVISDHFLGVTFDNFNDAWFHM
jgi:hypothetical protein